MKRNSKTKSILMVSTLLCLLGFSGVSHTVHLSGSCPMGHAVEMSGSENEVGAKRAEAECSNCHGTDGNGIGASDDVPNLAGQEFMYLCAWLEACRKRGKKCEGHEDIAAQLSDQEIVDLAMFYARLPSGKW